MVERHHIDETINNMLNDINFIKMSIYNSDKYNR